MAGCTFVTSVLVAVVGSLLSSSALGDDDESRVPTAHPSGSRTAESMQCFVEYPSSSTQKNMCEQAFFKFLTVSTASECADACVADDACVMFGFELQAVGPQCRLSSTCKEPLDALVGWNGYFRNSTVGDCAPPAPSWQRVFLSEAASKGAVCLDGSPGAYYIRNKVNNTPVDRTKWVVFMEGGGWTSSDEASVARSKTDLGSSKKYPAQPGGMEGLGMFGNVPFDNHTIVYAKYCDGGSWTGAMSNLPKVIDNTTIYYRGRGLLNALFDDLLDNQGMDSATELVFAGCSAGGLTTYIHADWVTATMHARAPHAKVVAVADAMFSLNHDDFAKDGHWANFMSWVYHTMDATGASVDEECVTAMAAKYGVPKGNRSEGWRCMFGSAVAPYVATPTFVLNSKYDTWQGFQIIGAGSCAGNITNCSSDIQAFWIDYGHKMVELLDTLPSRHGAYVHNCQSHCQTGPGSWTTDTVNGTSMRDAVQMWYRAALEGAQETVPRFIDRCDLHPCSTDVCDGQ